LFLPVLRSKEYRIINSKYLVATNEAGQKVNGLRGDYFNGHELQGEPAWSRIDSVIDMHWDVGSPMKLDDPASMPIENDYFSIRWTGQLIAPVSGEYELGIISDDGCRMFINGNKIVDGFYQHGTEEFSSKIELEAGKSYDIVVEYFETIGGALVHLVWTPPNLKTPKELFNEAVEHTRQADVAIYAGGINSKLEGEEMGVEFEGFHGGDRTRIALPKIQQKLLKAMYETGTPTIFVMTSGSAVAVNWADENIPAIIMAGYPGQRGGNAVADVIFGDYNPAGRLPVTFYKSVDELGDFSDYNMMAGKGKTYRYYKGKPLYPFGHGLSYSKFKYSDIKLSRKKFKANGSFTVSCKVKNVGDRDGEEVVQLYIRDVESSLPMPIKQLRGFERVQLKKGQKKVITFKLNALEDMRYYDARLRRYVVEPGEFEIQIGASSVNIKLTDNILVR